MRSPLLLALLIAACIEAPALRRPPTPLRLAAVDTPTGDLDATGRITTLTVRFDRAMAWPAADALLLVRGASSDGLRADAADGSLSATNSARRVSVRLARDPRDPSALTLDALAPLLPESALTLLVTPLARGEDGATLAAPDAGPRSVAIPLTVAPARRCGAIARVETVTPGEVPTTVTRVFVRFDRAVRGARAEQPLALVTEAGVVVPTRAVLDCFDDDGYARCAAVAPIAPLAARTVHRVVAGALRSRNGAAVEGVLGAVTTGERREATRVAWAMPPVCGADERALVGFCVRAGDRTIELRAATTTAAVVRLTATPLGAPAAVRVAVSAAGTLHGLRLPGLRPGVTWRLAVEALGADGRVHALRDAVTVATLAARPRVRVSEVLARPRTTSAQEYVELVNEEMFAVDVSAWSIAQGVTRSPLPDGSVLRARGRAVVVGMAFDPRGDVRAGDPPVAPGATVFVTRTGVAGRGLRDDGADLALLDAAGSAVARVPTGDPGRPPREGVGLVRADTDLDDDDPAAWAYDAEGGCTPGAPDRVR
jgi:hypothetical protein